MSTATIIHPDTDGVPPGLDTELNGQEKIIEFSGIFYARPDMGEVTFQRKVVIVFASKEVYVAYDLELRNLYVVDRASSISLGCRMHAELK
jgi:hypothetical protein